MSTIQVADHDIEFRSDDLVELRDSSDLLGDDQALRDRLAEDGYLFLRGLHDPDLVRAARREVLEHMADDGMLDPDEPVGEGIIHPEIDSIEWDMDRGSRWAQYPLVEKLSTGDATMSLMESIIDERVFTLDFRWGRAKARGGFTSFHADLPFMNFGTDQLYTKWQPVGACPLEQGPLVVVPGSHADERLRETYGQTDVNDGMAPMMSSDPYDMIETFETPLATASFEPGDALVFSCYTVHGSLTNRTDRYRISIDNRYQPHTEPADPRYVGADPSGGLGGEGEYTDTPISELREEWGLVPSETPAP